MQFLNSDERKQMDDLADEKDVLKLRLHNVSLERKRILERGRQRKLRSQ